MPKYSEFYKKCKKIYLNNELLGSGLNDIYDLDFEYLYPSEYGKGLVELSNNYLDKVEHIEKQVDNFIKDGKNLLPQEKEVKHLAKKIKNSHKITGLDDVCAEFVPYMEANVFKSYVNVDRIHIYRSLVTEKAPASSWLWHYDNRTEEIVKIMIYLTDVTEDTGPFEFLDDGNGNGVKIKPGKPKWPGTRVPSKALNNYLDKGYHQHKVTGNMGTAFLFDNNIIHKANVPKDGHRDVMIIRLRPYKEKLRPFVINKWTGDHRHVAEQKPNELTPKKK